WFSILVLFCFFFFNDTPTTEIYTLSLHDALPIWPGGGRRRRREQVRRRGRGRADRGGLRGAARGHEPAGRPRRRRAADPRRQGGDRKSTRLNSSHRTISYAVFCLKKKKNKTQIKQ